MNVPPVARRSDPDAELRDRLSSMQGLLALSMVMTETDDEEQILRLSATSVPSLARCRPAGVHLAREGWRMTSGACDAAEVRADLEAQFVVLSSAGGPVAIMGESWSWAFPLRNLDGHDGFLVVAADQQPSASEQYLLRVLAQETGIALANARSHTLERNTSAELRSANASLAASVAALKRSTAIHDRLTRVAVAGEGREGIARALNELTGYPVAIEDRDGNVHAWAGGERPDPYPRQPQEVREEVLRRAQPVGRPVRDGGRLLAVAQPRPDVVGVLVLVDAEATAGDQEQIALEHGATVLAMELARLHSMAETELRLGRDLADELLAGADGSVVSRANAVGFDLGRPQRVVIVDSPGPGQDGDTLVQAVRRALGGHGAGALVVLRGRTVVVLCAADRDWAELHPVVQGHVGGRRCRMGVGGRCVDLADFPRSRREAQLALTLSSVSGVGDQVAAFDDLGIYRILADVGDTSNMERFVREWLGSLLDYDAEKRSTMVATLAQYLEHGRNYDSTADALAVHRSTLKYRLHRIREISGHQLADPDTQFNLQLATRARRTLLALRGEEL